MVGCSLDLLGEIFSWLPTESLIRFKCVSKYWYALINSLMRNPEFVNKHLHNMNKLLTTSCLVFCCPGYGHWRHPEMKSLRRKIFKSLTIFHGDEDVDSEKRDCRNYVPQEFDLPFIPGTQHASDVVGIHCNGIICQAEYQTVVLCNPATKEWRALPKPCLNNDGCFVSNGVGFGYDLRANNYKVVRFGFERIPHGWVDYRKSKAEVYSMSTDSWREIGIHLKFDRFPVFSDKFYCKGVFYWSMWVPMYIIVSFDLSDEVFNIVPLPNKLLVTKGGRINPTLTVWNESVALIFFQVRGGVAVSFELWVMDDYSGVVKGSCSWVEKLFIGPLVNISTPLTFLKSDDLLMEATDGSLILYNLRSQVLRKCIQAVNRLRCWDLLYVKSLVSVQGGSRSRS